MLKGFDSTRIGTVQPDCRQRDFYRGVGLALRPLEPVDDARLRAVGMQRLVAASCRVFGRVDLASNEPSAVSARALAALGGEVAGLKRGVVAGFMGTTRQAVRRLATKSTEQAFSALRLRIALEDRVSAEGLEPRRAS